MESLLTFSPRKSQDFVPVDLNLLAANFMRILHHKLKRNRGGLVRLDLEANLPRVRGIPAELKQVVLNWILIAPDAVGDDGPIDIRTGASPEDWLVLEAADNGCSMGAEVRSKLFEPFFYHQTRRPRNRHRTFRVLSHHPDPPGRYRSAERSGSGSPLHRAPAPVRARPERDVAR